VVCCNKEIQRWHPLFCGDALTVQMQNILSLS
jgi:hypothetical protein